MFALTRVSLSETPVYVAQVLHSHFLPWRCAEYFPFFPRTFHLRMVTGSYQLIGCPGPSPSVGKFQIFYGGEASPHAGSGWAVWVKMSLSKGVSPSSTWKEPLRKSSAIATWMLCHLGCCSRKNASEKSQDNSGYP